MGYLVLALCALSYGVGIVTQAVAARRTAVVSGLDVGLLGRLVKDRVYLVGFAAQVVGFVLAFFARASLPLYLVQAVSTSAVAVAALIGAVFLRWTVRPLDIAVIIAMAGGLVLVVQAAHPSMSAEMPRSVGFALFGLLGVVVAVAYLVMRRLTGNARTVVLGLLSGTVFAVLAISGRPIAGLSIWELPFQALAWLMVLAAGVGQVLQAASLQQGSSTAAMAPSYAMSTVLASVVGVLALGDMIEPGRTAYIVVGLAIVLAGVAALSVGGHHAVGDKPPVGEERLSL